MRNKRIENLIAVLLIGIGILLILDNIGVLKTDFKEIWQYINSIFFIALGVIIFYGYFKKGGEGWIVGSFFIIFGVLLWLGKLNVIDFVFSDVFKLWPLLIIYIGFSMIGKVGDRKKTRVHILNDEIHSNGNYQYQSFIGTFEYKHPNWKVKPLELRNVAGDFYLDFTKAFIPEEEIPITIKSWAGDVQILLPENLEFRIDAYVKAGEINVLEQYADGLNRYINYESPGYQAAIQKLDIIIDLKAGSIRVNKV